jgi:hypothetical protein
MCVWSQILPLNILRGLCQAIWLSMHLTDDLFFVSRHVELYVFL